MYFTGKTWIEWQEASCTRTCVDFISSLVFEWKSASTQKEIWCTKAWESTHIPFVHHGQHELKAHEHNMLPCLLPQVDQFSYDGEYQQTCKPLIQTKTMVKGSGKKGNLTRKNIVIATLLSGINSQTKITPEQVVDQLWSIKTMSASHRQCQTAAPDICDELGVFVSHYEWVQHMM